MWQRHTCRDAFDPRREIRESDIQFILDAARSKSPLFQDITSDQAKAKTNLSWVYAYPMLDYRSDVTALICLSGSTTEITDEFQKDLYTVAVNLAKNLGLIFEEANVPHIWKDSLLTLSSTPH